jgi:hypothetical protein
MPRRQPGGRKLANTETPISSAELLGGRIAVVTDTVEPGDDPRDSVFLDRQVGAAAMRPELAAVGVPAPDRDEEDQ